MYKTTVAMTLIGLFINNSAKACTAPHTSPELNDLIVITKDKHGNPTGSRTTYKIEFPSEVEGRKFDEAIVRLYQDMHIEQLPFLNSDGETVGTVDSVESFIHIPIVITESDGKMEGYFGVEGHHDTNLKLSVTWSPKGFTCSYIGIKKFRL